MFHVLCGYLFSMASNTIDSFDPFNIFELIDFLLTPCFFHHLRVPRRLAWLLPWREMQRFESIVRRSCGRSQLAASRWKRCLIMAAMNLLASVAPPSNRFGILLATSLSVRGTKGPKANSDDWRMLWHR